MKTVNRAGWSILVSILWLLVSCDDQSGVQRADDPSVLKLTFTYGSEKEMWVRACTEAYNAQRVKSSSGKVVQIHAVSMGSGQCVDEVLRGERETHIISPASSVFVDLGNAESMARTGQEILCTTDSLCLSPVVIAMWKPMAEALGYGERAIGWKEIYELSLSDEGWAAYGLPQWGKFRFGHTHPDYSNSGILSLIAEAYAGAGKTANLTVEDVQGESVGDYIQQIEQAVVHYGASTGFFGRKMFDGGPGYLSAAVLYENMVIEAQERDDLSFPVVAVYPKEGTFWSDHPVGIVNRDYVSTEHKEAAQHYLNFLQERPQQEKAMQYGFRPADPAITLSKRFSLTNGVDPRQPMTTLEVPPVSTVQAIREVWEERKKRSHVVLAIDTSGSMKGQKMVQARKGALQLLEMLDDEDSFSLITFNSAATVLLSEAPLAQKRAEAERQISGLFAGGSTALYDSIAEGVRVIEASDVRAQNKISALVVLSDGEDSKNGTSLPALLQQLNGGEAVATSRVFTIGYGEDAKAGVLKRISNHTQAKYYKGTVENIREVFLSISTFF